MVVFRDKPLELWDIRTGTLLREMAKNFPTVTALVLTNLHNTHIVCQSNIYCWNAIYTYSVFTFLRAILMIIFRAFTSNFSSYYYRQMFIKIDMKNERSTCMSVLVSIGIQ